MEGDNGGQAFPVAGSDQNYPCAGMTMRDYFAAKAMASIVRRYDGHSFGGVPESPQYKELAGDSYFIADAMLKARGE
ncbi:MAG: hypothetical protein ACTID4_15055 [Hafnia alvei]|uniref:hypothetical protein n=1 Tax=Hafnia alvei TaxID=569 RepID=UPI003F8F9D2B